ALKDVMSMLDNSSLKRKMENWKSPVRSKKFKNSVIVKQELIPPINLNGKLSSIKVEKSEPEKQENSHTSVENKEKAKLQHLYYLKNAKEKEIKKYNKDVKSAGDILGLRNAFSDQDSSLDRERKTELFDFMYSCNGHRTTQVDSNGQLKVIRNPECMELSKHS